MNREIIVARSAGQCFGVKRAYTIALEAAASGDKVVMLGDIVHNEHVVARIEQAGVRVAPTIESITEPCTLLIRAHGAAPELYDQARAAGLKIVDATCPLVHEIHEAARTLAAEGYRLIVIGDEMHDEVVGIAEQAEGAIVLSSPEQVPEKVVKRLSRAGVVVQSTQNIDNVLQILSKLIPLVRELRYIDTICGPTKTHQRDIRELPLKVDVMIIVGSFRSANTCRLTEIAQESNSRTHQVEDVAGLRADWFRQAETVGVSAGASTPDWIIKSVVQAIEELP
ncbi:MAG: 4-hydroxy-3-methylbut-2-enyl diphosphate reductase [bacterium]|nr:4-hydroxy-3-methylbut-2-enyl diphosphate reductase [bacterium]